MIPRIEYDITLKIKAPFFSASQASQKFGIDSAILRDLDGYPALSGNSLKGLLSHSWKDLNKYGLNANILTWLGSGEEGKNSRSLMQFSHWFIAESNNSNNEAPEEDVRYRIEINAKGTVQKGSFQVIEAPFKTGETITIRGKTWLTTPAELTIEEQKTFKAHFQKCLEKGLNWIPSIGALNGIGFGKLLSAAVEEVSQKNLVQNTALLENDTVGLTLKFDRPICFAKPQQGKSEGNIFEASETIPGAAIIAIIANALPSEQRKIVDNLKATHAFPCEDTTNDDYIRVIPIPYSWANLTSQENPKGNLVDFATTSARGTPAFLLDWKSDTFATADKQRKWPTISMFEETRTAINSSTKTAANNQLFSTQLIDTRNLTWCTNLDFSQVPEQDKAILKSTLKDILKRPLAPFGKTDAFANAKLRTPIPFSIKSDSLEAALKKDRLTMTLVTDAEIFSEIPNKESSKTVESWRATYQAIFDKHSPNTFKIVNQFTREKPMGGNFLHQRFSQNKSSYSPKLLTEAGSVFVLEILDKEKAKTILDKWLKEGIPLLIGNDNWKNSPYRNFNGYGEIVLNLEAPKQGGSK